MEQLQLFGNKQQTQETMSFVNIKVDSVISYYTQEIKKLYSTFSNMASTPLFAKEYEYDAGVKPLIKVLESGAKQNYEWKYVTPPKPSISVSLTNNIVVCFSGGKDSTATAIKMREEGWNVHLFYVKGINKAYPDEMEHAKMLAKKLNMPIHIESLKQVGSSSFKENPIKNQLIASLALDYAIANNIGCAIAYGDFTTDNVNNSQFLESWSDTQEMWNAWVDFIKIFVPNIKLVIPFSTYNDTMNVMSEHPDIMESVCGCILPYRFRKITRENNEKRYEINLMPNRCGSCWKCCTEYIFLTDKGVLPLNKDFYNHCLEFLIKKTPSVHPEISVVNKETAFEAFLHYKITESILNK